MLRPDVDLRRWFLMICGNWANSQDRMERQPRRVDANASGEGMHVWNVEDMCVRKSLVGWQCSGRCGWNGDCNGRGDERDMSMVCEILDRYVRVASFSQRAPEWSILRPWSTPACKLGQLYAATVGTAARPRP